MFNIDWIAAAIMSANGFVLWVLLCFVGGTLSRVTAATTTTTAVAAVAAHVGRTRS